MRVVTSEMSRVRGERRGNLRRGGASGSRVRGGERREAAYKRAAWWHLSYFGRGRFFNTVAPRDGA
jgi:hypothetical protein